VSPDSTNAYTKFGHELADALENLADDVGLRADPTAALEALGITLPPGVDVSALDFDPDGLRRAADAIRAKAVPAFWPWVWWIPWVCFAPPEGGSNA
jgi:hypothetical protein